MKKKTNRNKKIVKLIDVLGLTYKEAGDIYGVTKQYVYKTYHKNRNPIYVKCRNCNRKMKRIDGTLCETCVDKFKTNS